MTDRFIDHGARAARDDYDRPWERMRHATDAELYADQRRHEDGEAFEQEDDA